MATELSDEQIVQAFHVFCVDALAQARAEGLLNDEDLETAGKSTCSYVDVQVAGPALALFFAALSARGSPPSICSLDGAFELTPSNCPETFRNAFGLWQRTVQPIQGFQSEARHDLALLLCDKEAQSSPLRLDVARIAADLKGIALEILQRRTFQTRFRGDLQAALNAPSAQSRVAYEPPPIYSEGEHSIDAKVAHEHRATHETPCVNADDAADADGVENLALIRETLYAALGDVMVDTPSILAMLARGAGWAPQAFFASTALAILDVALTRVDERGVRPVNLGFGSPRIISLNNTPQHLRPLLGGLIELSQASRALRDEDDARAVREAAEGAETLTPPRLDQLKERLAQGVGSTLAGEDEHIAGLANAVNQLALSMTALPAFRERQAQALQVLVAVTAL